MDGSGESVVARSVVARSVVARSVVARSVVARSVVAGSVTSDVGGSVGAEGDEPKNGKQVIS